jgi:hypothetical protein
MAQQAVEVHIVALAVALEVLAVDASRWKPASYSAIARWL